ncbi:hypothetical protein FJ970_30570 [Mesorhizobium sp. B2-1-8]|uniref:hypothetical protein n=1 Tax=Mesorhizobium sp. B2-1-8 TaxID=2589967 RepID=UPI00112B6308|nr:hypothetical protein [Mesorhizobium sp. B2-1-8]UCI19297.1 hypothetical protein FJ970_30570 [Mesorhizobium sp. B2-1-8]
MADSDNTTTLPYVTHQRDGGRIATDPVATPVLKTDRTVSVGEDPAIALLREWRRTQHVSSLLCRLQQHLERRVINEAECPRPVLVGARGANGVKLELRHQPQSSRLSRGKGASNANAQLWRACREVADHKFAYAIACEAEVLAMTAALKLQDELSNTPARTLAGIVAKLEIIAKADHEIDDPTDFPWPQIVSILQDLKAIAGSVHVERPGRSTIRADVAGHLTMAENLMRMERGDGDAR